MIDTRFNSERVTCTETICDMCYDVILESEKRYELEVDGMTEIICQSCLNIIKNESK